MICCNCGKEINEEALFCKYCGVKVEDIYERGNSSEESEEFRDDIKATMSVKESNVEDSSDKEIQKEEVVVQKDSKNNKKKRNWRIAGVVIIAIIVVAMVVTAVVVDNYKKQHKCGDNLTWNYDKSTGTLTISGDGSMYDSESTWDFNEVGEISSGSIKGLSYYGKIDSSKLEELVIEEGCTSIGKSAFGWFDIKNVKLPNSLNKINEYAFCKCNNLSEVNIPENVTEIGDYAFNDCRQLEKIKIPKSVKFIGKNALQRHIDQETIDINITYLGTKDEWNSFASDVDFVGVVICTDGEIRHENNWNIEEEKFIGSWEERGFDGEWEIINRPEGLVLDSSGFYKFADNRKGYFYKVPFSEIKISKGNNLSVQNSEHANEYSGMFQVKNLKDSQNNNQTSSIFGTWLYNHDYKIIDENTIVADDSISEHGERNVSSTVQSKITLRYNPNDDTLTVINWTDFSDNVISRDQTSSVTDRSRCLGVTYKRKSNTGVYSMTLNSDHTGTKPARYSSGGEDTIRWSLENINNPNTAIIHSSEDNYYHSDYLRYDPNTGRVTYEPYESSVKYTLTKK